MTHVIFESDVPGIPMATGCVYRRWFGQQRLVRRCTKADLKSWPLISWAPFPGLSPSNRHLITRGELHHQTPSQPPSQTRKNKHAKDALQCDVIV